MPAAASAPPVVGVLHAIAAPRGPNHHADTGFRRSSKLRDVCDEIRGPVVDEANALEEAGHQVMRLNTGNPALFDFEARAEIVQDMIRTLPSAHGYADSRGVLSARRAVAQRYQAAGIDVDEVLLGDGVSELISMAVQGLLEDGDEVLVPAPDHPLWTAVTTLAGGRAVHDVCDEAADWTPDLADTASKITDRTTAIVVIDPDNPTGAVYPRAVLDRRPRRPRRAAARAARSGLEGAQRDPRRELREAPRGALRVPAPRPGRPPDPRRRAVRARPAARGEDPGRPGRRLQLAAPDHFHILTLPHAADLDDAIGRIGTFLETYRQ